MERKPTINGGPPVRNRKRDMMSTSSKMPSAVRTLMVISWVLILSLLFVGCHPEYWIEVMPESKTDSVTLFNRYRLQFFGRLWAEQTGELYSIYVQINSAFIQRSSDTGNLDTVPIFVIDTLCLSGECLGVGVCKHPMRWTEDGYGPPLPYGKKLLSRIDEYGDPGLWYVKKKLIPGGFIEEGPFLLNSDCKDSSLQIEFRARLLNRHDGKEISRETKRVLFRVRRMKSWEIMSMLVPQTEENGRPTVYGGI